MSSHQISRRSVGIASLAGLAAVGLPSASGSQAAPIGADARLIEIEAALLRVHQAVEREMALENCTGYAEAKQQAEAAEAELDALADRILGTPVRSLADVALRARLAEYWSDRQGDLLSDESRYSAELVRSVLDLVGLAPISSGCLERIVSVAQLVEALGGREAVAAYCLITPNQVARWERTGEIPTGWHYRFAIKARQRGYALDETVFGIVS